MIATTKHNKARTEYTIREMYRCLYTDDKYYDQVITFIILYGMQSLIHGLSWS